MLIKSDETEGPIVSPDIPTCGGALMHILDATPVPYNLSELVPEPVAVPPPQAAAALPPTASSQSTVGALAAFLPPPLPVAPPAGPASGCVPSLWAAVASNPQLTILHTMLGISQINLTSPDLNYTFFAPLDEAIQSSLAELISATGSTDFAFQLADSARLCRAIVSYFLVPEGGLTLEHLQAMDGAILPTLLDGRELQVQVQPNATNPQVSRLVGVSPPRPEGVLMLMLLLLLLSLLLLLLGGTALPGGASHNAPYALRSGAPRGAHQVGRDRGPHR